MCEIAEEILKTQHIKMKYFFIIYLILLNIISISLSGIFISKCPFSSLFYIILAFFPIKILFHPKFYFIAIFHDTFLFNKIT